MGSAATATTATATATVAAGTTAAATAATAGTMAAGAAALGGAYGMTAAVVAGAVGGFAGAAVSSAIGSAMGVASFSWRGALASGITGGITAGIGNSSWLKAIAEGTKYGHVARAAVSAGLGSVAGYGANKAMGVESTHFSWKNVLISAATAAGTSYVSPYLSDKLGFDLSTGAGQAKSKMLSGAIAGTAGVYLRHKFGLSKRIDYSSVAADVIGSMIGGAITGEHALDAAEYGRANLPAVEVTSQADDSAPFNYEAAIEDLRRRYGSADQPAIEDGGAPKAPVADTGEASKYTNDPNYVFLPFTGKFVRRSDLAGYVKGSHHYSDQFAAMYGLPTVDDYVQAYGPMSDGNEFMAYYAWNNDIAWPLHRWMKDINDNPEKYAAIIAENRRLVAADEAARAERKAARIQAGEERARKILNHDLAFMTENLWGAPGAIITPVVQGDWDRARVNALWELVPDGAEYAIKWGLKGRRAFKAAEAGSALRYVDEAVDVAQEGAQQIAAARRATTVMRSLAEHMAKVRRYVPPMSLARQADAVAAPLTTSVAARSADTAAEVRVAATVVDEAVPAARSATAAADVAQTVAPAARVSAAARPAIGAQILQSLNRTARPVVASVRYVREGLPQIVRVEGWNGFRSVLPFGMCFLAGTPVHAKDGVRPIETIRVGDWVAARTPYGERVQWRPVLQVFIREDMEAVRVFVEHSDGAREAISCTTEHPFHVVGKGWCGANSLESGDQLELLNGEKSTVVGVESVDGQHAVYNFEVADDHTYFVGERGIWVHNASRISGVPMAGQATRVASSAPDAASVEMFRQLNRELGKTVLFGQKLIGKTFASIGSDAPDYIRRRTIYEVASDLSDGLLTSDDILIHAFRSGDDLISLNNRGLAALSLAGLKPTKIIEVIPSRQELKRLLEMPIRPDLSIPGPRIAVTRGKYDLKIDDIISIPNW
ncbi:hypothetical protein GCM10023307_28410 [Lysobacter hankyongensis]|uniref:Intein C-terminal splicing domain-containing protein n=2 Tax=Lysobacter hankyongensis TaxID=1176535 RepID=A0ABP9BUI2_9GAMM